MNSQPRSNKIQEAIASEEWAKSCGKCVHSKNKNELCRYILVAISNKKPVEETCDCCKTVTMTCDMPAHNHPLVINGDNRIGNWCTTCYMKHSAETRAASGF